MLHRDERVLLGAFATWRKETISFVMSVRPHGTTSLRLARFSWNLIFEDVSRICRENSNLTRTTCTLHEAPCNYMTVFRWMLLRMINISDKGCRDNQDTHFILNTLSCPNEIMWGGGTQNALLHFDCNNGSANARQCYDICTLLFRRFPCKCRVLLTINSEWKAHHFLLHSKTHQWMLAIGNEFNTEY